MLTGTISLETSKNGEPREVPMTGAVREVLTALVVGKKPNAFVFSRDREGSQLRDFRKTWANVCVAAGVGALHCPTCDEALTVSEDDDYKHCGRKWRRSELTYAGLIFHDLRRCAVRGLIRAGVAQKTAMTITGHKTIAVFQRYHIVAPGDKQEAVRKLELSQEQEREFLKKSQALDFGQSSGMVAQKSGQTGNLRSSSALPN